MLAKPVGELGEPEEIPAVSDHQVLLGLSHERDDLDARLSCELVLSQEASVHRVRLDLELALSYELSSIAVVNNQEVRHETTMV